MIAVRVRNDCVLHGHPGIDVEIARCAVETLIGGFYKLVAGCHPQPPGTSRRNTRSGVMSY